MKVLNILTSPLVYDGISMSNMNYFRNMDKNKIQIDFVVPVVEENIKKEIEEEKGHVYLIEGRRRATFTYMKKLIKLIREKKYDIVQAHGSSAILCIEMIAAKKAGCKIRIAHSRNTKADHKIADKLLRPIFYRTYTHGFACGEEAGKWLFGNRKFEIINNGKNVEEYQFNYKIRKEMREKNGLDNKIVIGHVGNFNEQKNHNYLIDIFYELTKNNGNKYKLILLGDGGLRKDIEEKVKNLKLENQVLFVGKTAEVSKWLQAMDIMVFPSKFEGFPNVLVEWQIAGLPCLISDKITDKVKLTNLVQFESIEEKPKKWAIRIKNIKLEDREANKEMLLTQIKEKGFDIKENARRLEKIYMQLYNIEQEHNA